MRTLALVESPAQLVNVLEWAHQTSADLARLSTVVLAPKNEMSRMQLRRTAELAKTAGHRIRWCEPRLDRTASLRAVGVLAREMRGVDRLVIGDPFSGLIQLVLGLSRLREVVVVDDGSATIEFARLWTAGLSLARWHSNGLSARRRHIAAQARRRMDPSRGCRITVFSCMPVQIEGADVVRNDYSWVRTAFGTPQMKPTADLIGSSLVETGVVEREHYLHGVATLAAAHQIDRYFAHRKESVDKLAIIAAMGMEIVRPDLPLELVSRRDVIGETLISFPSTVVHTLPLVLADTRVRLLICTIADQWYTSQAPSEAHRFLGSVANSARQTHGLLSVAC